MHRYAPYLEEQALASITRLAEPLAGRRLIMINSTKRGGGVAELLESMVGLFGSLGLECEWLDLRGDDAFFAATKTFHNAMQGEPQRSIDEQIRSYETFYHERFAALNTQILERLSRLDEQDVVVIHDPQPLALIRYRNEADGSRWIWRCHIDTTAPEPTLREFVTEQLRRYDAAIASREEFTFTDTLPWTIIPPSIDPITEKNRDLSAEEVERLLAANNVPLDKPLLTQVSRLDKWKDPIGVIEAFRKARARIDCRLALIYNGATDDPEGAMMHERVSEALQGAYRDDILLLRGDDPLFVNAMQRASLAVVQKSLREGFGLTVSEALWKGTPVIATRAGGIPLQITHAQHGYLVDAHEIDAEGEPACPIQRAAHIDAVAEHMIDLLANAHRARAMGAQARNHVRRNFLITRHIADYLQLIAALDRQPRRAEAVCAVESG